MNKISIYTIIICGLFLYGCQSSENQKSGNPVIKGWYADPEGIILEQEYWIYPTYSAPYAEQTFMDAFSSPDLVNWTRHPRVIDTTLIAWADSALWAPSPVFINDKYYLFFAANDIQSSEAIGGIGVGVSDDPSGPFKDAIGNPLIGRFHNGAQPIDAHVFIDDDKQAYLYYGGWRHCNVAKLNPDMISFEAYGDGTIFKEITPEGYVEGPCMIKRKEKYYFMWSEGNWTGPDYSVAYAISESPLGPFKREGTILQQDMDIATGAGHHSVIHIPDSDIYYIVYHRRPLAETDRNHRVTCIDRLYFDNNEKIKPVTITREGVASNVLK